MSREKIFLTVLTYPQPSNSYDDCFCTAGFREDGSMIRIYPLPFSHYYELHKYSVIELEVKIRGKGDFRPESFSPVDFNLKDLKIIEKVDTKDNWAKRKEICLKNVYTDFDKLLDDSKAPKNTSLVVFKPKKIIDFVWEEDERDWKPGWRESMKQLKLFDDSEKKIKLEKVPYKFKYHFTDSKNKIHKLTVLDWEVGTLYRNCLKASNGDEKEALEKVRQKFFDEFLKRDIHFFLGTTHEWHLRRAKNPFVIIGVFYPPKTIDKPPSLF